MQFLADENFPFPSVRFLSEKNIQVNFIEQNIKGMSDEDILEMAFKNNQIILTFDKDFGELVYREKHRNVHGIILVRMNNYLPDEPGKILFYFISQKIVFGKYFSVIKSFNKIKQTSLENLPDALEEALKFI